MRITSGEYKNRQLFVPEGDFIRPTSDRMRQSIFNILRHPKWDDEFDLNDIRVLDIFCGSGSLGLEALSNGASHCTFIDQDVRTVRKNTGFIPEDDLEIVQSSALSLKQGSGDVGLVFMDPPYRQNLVEPTLQKLIDNQWLLDNAIVSVECEKNLKIVCDLELLDTRSQSQSDLHFFRYNTAVE
jgi:16S rRNA (guanine966-N2)-methyltransferase